MIESRKNMKYYLFKYFNYIYGIYSVILFGILHCVYPIYKSLGLMIAIIGISYLVGYYLTKKTTYYSIIIEKYLKKYIILTILLVCWISFSIGGVWLFTYETAMFYISIKNLIKFILLTIWVFPILLSVFIFLEEQSENLAQKLAVKKENNKRFMIIFFIIILGIHLLYLFAYYPAIIGHDVWDQFSQLQRNNYNDWHPVAHTIYLKIVTWICDTPAAIALFQIVLFDIFLTSFFEKFRENGISEKLLYFIGILISLNVFSGMNFVSLWKDSIFTICIIGLSYYLYLYLKYKEKFFQWINLVGFILSMIGIYTFRHNGSITVLLSSILLLIMGIKNREKLTILSIGIIFLCIGIWKGPVYHTLEITTFPKVKFNPIYHGVASVLKKNERTTLEGKKFLEDMEKILPYDTWIEKYDPYNWDSLQSVWNFESVELSDALSMYFDAFFYSPGQIVMARLVGSELMWNIFPAQNSFERFIDNSKDIVYPNTEEIRYDKEKPNILTKIIEKMSEIFNQYNILLCLTARGGIYFNIILICSLFLIVNRKKEIGILFPLFGNIISLLIAMAYQDFRYIWFIILLCPIILMITLLSKREV